MQIEKVKVKALRVQMSETRARVVITDLSPPLSSRRRAMAPYNYKYNSAVDVAYGYLRENGIEPISYAEANDHYLIIVPLETNL